ncbi:MAG TPA: tetratricopeptide repeat protein, partial [Gammaproteobacteria bacterium]
KRVEPVAASDTVASTPGRKLDFAIIAALTVALSFFAYEYFNEEDAGSTARAGGVLPNSIAVLPLDNLSPDPDNAYFASGLHEEILNQLVKLRNLNVISRTSVLQYAENRPAIQEIAEALNVQSVMEGSVRYDANGGRIRVTAQLIDPDTGAHLWSETYDRNFENIFAVESDIAMNIANALAAEISPEEQQSIETRPTVSSEAYALYLRSFNLGDALALELLDEALALDENFAEAHARKAWLSIRNVFMGSTPAEIAEAEGIVERSAMRALQINPRIGLAHAALATVHQAHWRGEMAEAEFQLAYDRAPSDALVALAYGRFRRYRGDFAGAVERLEQAVRLSPNEHQARGQLALAYLANKDYAEAADVFRTIDEGDEGAMIGLAGAEIGLGNYDEAVRGLELIEERSLQLPPFRLSQLAITYAAAGQQEDAARLFAAFRNTASTDPVGDAVWARAYLAVGENELALEHLRSAVMERATSDQPTLSEFTANFLNLPQLDEPEFLELLNGLWD